MKANEEIRQYARSKKVYLWEVAEKYPISEPQFIRWMRHEFSEQEKQRILSLIDEIANERR